MAAFLALLPAIAQQKWELQREIMVRTALEAEGTIPPMAGPAVIVLHGLGEGRSSMRPIANHLRKTLDANVLLFGYASTATTIEAQSATTTLG